MSWYSNFINSFLQYRPFSWFTNKGYFLSSLVPTTSGMLRRQGSNTGVQSNMSIGTRDDYAYEIDTCQTIYLVEKRRNGTNGTYRVTILYTKEISPFWLEQKIKMIMLRILVAEQQIPVLNKIFKKEGGWKIIGSVDCQRDRAYSVNQFHQDSLLSAFIHPIHEPFFVNFLRDIFSPEEEYFSPTVFPGVSLGGPKLLPSSSGLFKVYDYSKAHFGILDYDSIAKIIAAAIRTHDHILLATFPASTDFFRPFLFYLNSIIHHATPSSLTQDEINKILAYYSNQDPLNPIPLPSGFTSLQGGGKMTGGARQGSLEEALNDYNILFDEAINHPRRFRRLLGKILPTEGERWKNRNKIIQYKQGKITAEYERRKLFLNKMLKRNSGVGDEKLNHDLYKLENDKNDKMLAAEEYKSVEEMIDKLKVYFYSNSTYKYPEDTDPIARIAIGNHISHGDS